ncbi:glycogen/starch/alpha-glucan phosphorylase, partial [[Clostridium] scindens]
MGEDGKAIVNHVPSLIVRAVPYDMPIVGQNTNLTNTLRLWSAEVADDACDASSLNEYVNEVREICRNVYP